MPTDEKCRPITEKCWMREGSKARVFDQTYCRYPWLSQGSNAEKETAPLIPSLRTSNIIMRKYFNLKIIYNFLVITYIFNSYLIFLFMID